MRVSDNMNYAQVVNNLGKNRKEASELNNQAATMKRVTKPSDDPAGTARVLSSRTDISNFTQFDKSLNYAKSFLDFSEQSLSELSDLLIRLKELAIGQANSAGANAQTRRATAAEVEQLYQQSLHIANRKMGDRYLFGGFKTDSPPFNGKGEYKGDDGELMIEVDKSSYVPMNIPGSKIFLGKGYAIRTLVGLDEGVAKNTDELRQLQMEIQQSEMGEKPDSVSPDGADVRGPASEANLSEGHSAEKNGENIFGTIRALYNGLVTNDTTAIQSSLDRLDESVNQAVMARAQLGSRMSNLNAAMDSLSRQTIDSKTLASSIEDANAFELFSDMSKNETTLKATLDSSGRLITPSLLDFLK